VETAVARVADDIIAISDITADESERLKQICEVLKHVEDIFSGHVSTPKAAIAFQPINLIELNV